MISTPTLAPATADVLLELVNIGVGRAARGLSELTGREVTMTIPTLELINHTAGDHVLESCHGITIRVSQAFSGGIGGHAMLVLNRAGAVRLAELLLGKEAGDDAFDVNEQGAMLELGNIVIGNVIGLLASELDAPVEYEMPQLQLRGTKNYIDLISDIVDPRLAKVIIMRASLSIREDRISGYFLMMFPDTSLAGLISKLTCLATP